MVEPSLLDDSCRVTVTRYKGRRCIEKDVYEDLTLAEALDVIDQAGVADQPFKPDGSL